MTLLSIAAPRQMSRGGGEAGPARRITGRLAKVALFVVTATTAVILIVVLRIVLTASRIPSWERTIDQFLSRLFG